jgi:myo-inositol-hexaphosphate 3-phosphohydrolase
MKNKFWLRCGLFLLISSFLLSAAVTIISILPIYETEVRPETNTLDSPAIWVGDNPENSILFISAKGSHNVEMHNPVTNEFAGVLGQAGSGPGEFSYPNGIAVAYDFNYNGNLIDLVMVVERDNHRVSAFDLPGLNFLGTFGDNDLDQPYGIAVYQEGSDIYAYITETGSNEGIFIYKLTTGNNTFSGTLIKHFPVNGTLESLVIDPYLKRTLICNEIAAGYIFVYSLRGDTLITTFGQGHFSGDTEGIVLYDCGQDSGYVIVADQLSPTEFEVFSRKTYQHIGNFCGADPYKTSGTDGTALTQRSLPNLPHGAYFAVHSDRTVHCYDWSDIANAFGLCNNTLAPEPNITVSPGTLNYGDVVINTALSKVAEVRNNGGADLIVDATSLAGSNAGEFSIDSGGAPFTLSPGESRDITVSFNPVSAGLKSAALRIESNDPDDDPFDVPLSGTGIGIPPVWSIPAVLEFPEDDTLSLDLDSLLSDENDPDSTLAITYQGGGHVSVSLNNATHLVIFTAPLNFNGTDTVIFTATDPGGFSASDTATIMVTPVNDPPTLELPESLEFSADTSAILKIWEYAHDVETEDSLLSYNFSTSNDSLRTEFNASAGELTLSALAGFNGSAFLYVSVSDDSGAIALDSMEVIISPLTGIGSLFGENIPTEYVIHQNYPNPFNPATHIRFGLPRATHVKLTIYNIIGQQVAVLVDGERDAGYHVVNFDGAGKASGIYLYHLQAGNFQTVKKMLLLK